MKDKSFMFRPQSLLTLQEAVESFLVNMFDQYNQLMIDDKTNDTHDQRHLVGGIVNMILVPDSRKITLKQGIL